MLDPLVSKEEIPPHVRAILRMCVALMDQVRAGEINGVVLLTFKDGRADRVMEAGDVPPYVASDACRRLAKRLDWG